MKTFLIIIIPLISLILAILPFWYVRKKYRPNIKWRHLGAAFLAAVAFEYVIWFIVMEADTKIGYKIRPPDLLLDTILLSWLILSLLLITAPVLIYKLKYPIRSKKGYWISVAISLAMLIFMIALWIFIIILGMAQLQRLG